MRKNSRPIIEPLPFMAKFLHWVVALFFLGLLGSGIYMDEYADFTVYPLHKSFGVIAFVFILWRVLRRLIKGWPIPVSQYQIHEQLLVKLVHWVLILGTLIMPVSGMMMTAMGGHGIFVFGIEVYPVNYATENSQVVVPVDIDLASLGNQIHGFIAKVMMGAILLHVLGAFKNHFIDKDNTLRRMLGLQLK